MLILAFSLKIATIAVALLVDKSQLFAIGPEPAYGSSSVCPSIRTERSGLSPRTFPNSTTAFLPSVPTAQLPELKSSLFSIETYTFPFFCSTVKPLPSKPFKAFDKVSFSLRIDSSLAAIISSSSFNRLAVLSRLACSSANFFDFASNCANNSRFLFIFFSNASLLFFSRALYESCKTLYLFCAAAKSAFCFANSSFVLFKSLVKLSRSNSN